MQTYVSLRRGEWATAQDLEAAAARSTAEGDQMPDDIRWIRSYVLAETDGGVGTVCVYQPSSPEAIREHASRADMPADEIFALADTMWCDPIPNRSRRCGCAQAAPPRGQAGCLRSAVPLARRLGTPADVPRARPSRQGRGRRLRPPGRNRTPPRLACP
jgi:Protein of unknown function (DUF4242)